MRAKRRDKQKMARRNGNDSAVAFIARVASKHQHQLMIEDDSAGNIDPPLHAVRDANERIDHLAGKRKNLWRAKIAVGSGTLNANL